MSANLQPGTMTTSQRRQQLEETRFIDIRNLAYITYKKQDGSPLLTYEETLNDRDMVKATVLQYEIASGALILDGTENQPSTTVVPQQAVQTGAPQMNPTPFPQPPQQPMQQPQQQQMFAPPGVQGPPQVSMPPQQPQQPPQMFAPVPQPQQIQQPPQAQQYAPAPQQPPAPFGAPPPAAPQQAAAPQQQEQPAAAPAGRGRRTKAAAGTAVAPPPAAPPQNPVPQQQYAPAPQQQVPVQQFAPAPQAPQGVAPPMFAPQPQAQAPQAAPQPATVDLSPLIARTDALAKMVGELGIELNKATQENARILAVLHHLYMTNPSLAPQLANVEATLPAFRAYIQKFATVP